MEVMSHKSMKNKILLIDLDDNYMEKQDKVFVDGMNVQLPSEKAPEYILLRMGFNAQKFFRWCQDHQDEKGWVNITIKKSQKGSIYGELDTWKPKVDGATLADTAEAKGREAFVPSANDEIENIPF